MEGWVMCCWLNHWGLFSVYVIPQRFLSFFVMFVMVTAIMSRVGFMSLLSCVLCNIPFCLITWCAFVIHSHTTTSNTG